MKIMVALDLSDYADFVLIKAVKTARQQNAKLDIVVVVENHGSSGFPADGEQVRETLTAHAARAARAYQEKALSRGVKAKVRILAGTSAAEEIVTYQQAEKLDLIVLGRRSAVSGTKASLGAVTQKILDHATCTVMVVRCMDGRNVQRWAK